MKLPLESIEVELVAKKLEKLGGYLRELEQLVGLSLKEYERDVRARRATERLLQIIIETACDINGHFVAKLARKAPASRRDSFHDLASLGVLHKDVAQQLAQSVGLRNRLVHDYDVLSDRLVHQAAQEALDQYAAYGRTIHRILRGEGAG